MISAVFSGLQHSKNVVTLLRAFEPAWANRICENYLKAAIPALQHGRESELVNQADKLARHINDSYVRPNFGKHRPILSCVVSEEDDVLQLVFNIPFQKGQHDISIKVRPDLSVHVRWPEPNWRDMGKLLASLVYGNDLRGKVRFDHYEPISFRAGLIVATLGPELSGPILDMAQDQLIEDFPCVSSTHPRASGLKNPAAETLLEL